MGKSLDIYDLSGESVRKKKKTKKSWIEKSEKLKKKKKAKEELKDIEVKRKKKKKEAKIKIDSLKDKLSNTNDIRALFGKDAISIQNLLENKENDNAITLARKSMLQMTLDLIPLAEEDYRKRRTDRSVYALNALLSQVRELIADIQADADKEEVINRILVNILHPSLLLLGNQLINTTFELQRRLEEHIDKDSKKAVKKVLEETSKDLGKFAQGLFNDLRDKITKELSET